MPSSDFHGHCTNAVHMHIGIYGQNTQTYKINLKHNFAIPFFMGMWAHTAWHGCRWHGTAFRSHPFPLAMWDLELELRLSGSVTTLRPTKLSLWPSAKLLQAHSEWLSLYSRVILTIFKNKTTTKTQFKFSFYENLISLYGNIKKDLEHIKRNLVVSHSSFLKMIFFYSQSCYVAQVALNSCLWTLPLPPSPSIEGHGPAAEPGTFLIQVQQRYKNVLFLPCSVEFHTGQCFFSISNSMLGFKKVFFTCIFGFCLSIDFEG